MWRQIFLLILIHNCSGGLFGWIWEQRNEPEPPKLIDGTPLYPIPFESLPDDEKFLSEASKFTDLIKSSQLDTCQHKVIMKLQSSCTGMTEEELAKLSVNLLNCQSQVDGRKTFICTDSMSLKECTGPMDANMWNAYHLMNNRARTVCLSARKAQFHALSEMTVNKLMSTAQEQIFKLKTLQEGQERLESMAIDTLTSLDEGHKELLGQQEKLMVYNQGIQSSVAHNLRQLTKEKALIAAGHQELARMTEDVRNKIDQSNKELAVQSNERSQHHQELLRDIEHVRQQAEIIFSKIDESSSHIISQHKVATAQYEATLQNLKKINETVMYLLHLVNMTRSELDQKLEWIKTFMGESGDQMERVYDVIQHLMYLFLGMLAAAFLNLPLFTRAALILLVPLNLFVLEAQGREQALDFPKMTILLFLATLLDFIVRQVHKIVRSPTTKNMQYLKYEPRASPSSTQTYSKVHVIKQWTSAASVKVNSLLYGSNKNISPVRVTPDVLETEATYDTPLQRADVTSSGRKYYAKPVETEQLRSSTPSSVRSNRSSLSNKPMCEALCKNGKHCRNPASPNTEFCFKHQ